MQASLSTKPGGAAFEEPARSGAELQMVSFHVGGEEFGLDILRVQEIIRLQHLTRVPNAPESVSGVMNLRGKIIPVIALRTRFALEPAAADKQTRIVVVEVKGAVLGLIVDAVSEVLRIPAETIEPPSHAARNAQEYVSGIAKIEDRLLILLDVGPPDAGCRTSRSPSAPDVLRFEARRAV